MVDRFVNPKHNNAKNKGKKVKQEADEPVRLLMKGKVTHPNLMLLLKLSQMIVKLLTKLRKVHSILLSLSVTTIMCLLVKPNVTNPLMSHKLLLK